MRFNSKQRQSKAYCENRLPQTDEEFISGCGVLGSAEGIAVGVRRVIARLGSVDPVYIHHDARFIGEINQTDFWDRLDSLAIVLELEEELECAIDDDAASQIRNPEMKKNLTVADFVGDVINVVSAR
ncbi:MAG: hypothetical protein JNL18_24685 [Planctomycetaceae bacterium]|nr:hypothetical protein [Planctomycetaceae bacterium]